DRPRTVNLEIQSGREQVMGMARLEAGEGWQVSPEVIPFRLDIKGSQQSLQFELTPPAGQVESEVRAVVTLADGEAYELEKKEIAYDHIPRQTIFTENKSKAVKVDLQKGGSRIGYIMGAGDDVPVSLVQAGYEVELLDVDNLSAESLMVYDAVVIGIRAYNTVDELRFKQEQLFRYVEEGGTLVVQYQKSSRFDSRLVIPMEEIAPYELQITRDRVTVEEADMTFLEPGHSVLNHPNQIGDQDFEGWVQERGLYFAGEWDEEAWTPIFSCHDPGETAKKGSLLVARYGEGHYVYTGLSFFRQLPAGVPGAFRLFANILALGQEEEAAGGRRR
ncbi:MAG: LmbE family protein, partial [Saprospiraceae bacterium]|nr:LmbE family protein [Saprospiraceae bacterium]